jgi:hypothetical protein
MSLCADYRRAVLTNPQDVDAGLRAHQDACADCTEFAHRASQFEGRLARALRLDMAASTGPKVIPLEAARRRRAARTSAPTVGRRGWLALAASVTVAIAVGLGLWLAAPAPSLAQAVVAHMAGEPQAWRTTDVSVPPEALGAVLAEAHVHLTPAAGVVSYASSCEFRGHRVPHLVVQTDQGPVTVMVLVHEPASRAATFDETGYRGVILPVAGHGSIAVLTHGQADPAAIARVAARVLGAIVWG